MTAIGVLTFVFFPGTFVAVRSYGFESDASANSNQSIFAMPLINWHPQKDESRLHSQFWLYPVVTICFTIFVLVVFLIPWLWLSNRIPRKPETQGQEHTFWHTLKPRLLGLWNKICRGNNPPADNGEV
jgi:hypothetical protein